MDKTEFLLSHSFYSRVRRIESLTREIKIQYVIYLEVIKCYKGRGDRVAGYSFR